MTLAFPLIGRDRELQRVKEALLNRRSLLILGPPGVGKSRLLEAATSETATQPRPLTIPFPAHPHQLLVKLASMLLDEHETHETSRHLRGALWRALALSPRPLIFEAVQGASAPMYRFLQPLFHTEGMCLIATAVSADRLGFLQRLFWDPRDRLELKPLRDRDARQLASRAAAHFRLPAAIDSMKLRERVLEAANGNPGRIVEMYRLAADSRYRRGDYVKVALIRVDLAARFTA